MECVPGKIKEVVKTVRRLFLKWSVQKPVLSMVVIIIVAVTLLPIVTATALMPIALFLTYTGVLASHGVFYVTYNIFLQGLMLAMVIVALFIVSFAIATSASVFHSYKIFKSAILLKKKQ